MATIYKAHGLVIDNFEPKNGKHFSLSELQAIVSGFIEIVYLKDDRLMIVNEEGKLNGLAINHAATSIFLDSFPYSFDVIVGDVLVCDSKQVR